MREGGSGRRRPGRLLAAAVLALFLAPPGPSRADHAAGHLASSAAGSNAPGGLLDRLGLGASSPAAPEFLDPEVAFELSAEAAGPDAIVVRWRIADAYYLYRERMRFELREPPGATIGPAELPAGKVKEDPYFGRMEVYYQGVEARIPVRRAAPGVLPVVLDVTYQGCADAGLCYPPITRPVTLSLPPSGATAAAPGPGAAAAPAGNLPEQDRLAGALASGNVWLVLPVFLGLGLLLTFTPCVLPMIPILSAIIIGQGERISTRRAFSLSLTYVLAMAATYTAAGVAAGLSGANLQAAFQSPWVIGAFSGLFVLLALSMFEVYDLQVPARLQERLARWSRRQRGGTLVGVAVMGFLSALIVGPCVAAPLAGALIYIARTGDALLGGSALFALSLGMGIPVLAFGTSAGRLLPRAGPWMRVVKAAFGVLLLGVAIYLVARIVPGWVALLGWAALFIVAAIYMGAFDGLTSADGGWRRLAKGAGLVVLVQGVLMMVGAASGGDDPFRPLAGLAGGGAREALGFEPVKGAGGLRVELGAATARGQPVMLEFYADWCVSCKELERETFSDPAVRTVLSTARLLRADVTAYDAEDRSLLASLGLYGPPAILFFGADGVERPQFRVVGFMPPDRFRTQAERGLWGGAALPAALPVTAQGE